MKRAADSPLEPPRWTQSLVLLALPTDPMRDAILGDLHEEFLREVVELGVGRARARHVARAAGIMAHALSDSAICRSWVSRDAPVETRRATLSAGAAQSQAAAGGPATRGPIRGIAAYAGFAALALLVLVAGIVVNTMLFSATRPQGPRVSSAAGIGGVALLLACVAVGAVVICAGPRWRRNRLRGT